MQSPHFSYSFNLSFACFLFGILYDFDFLFVVLFMCGWLLFFMYGDLLFVVLFLFMHVQCMCVGMRNGEIEREAGEIEIEKGMKLEIERVIGDVRKGMGHVQHVQEPGRRRLLRTELEETHPTQGGVVWDREHALRVQCATLD